MTPREKADKMIKSVKPPKAKGGDFNSYMSGAAKKASPPKKGKK